MKTWRIMFIKKSGEARTMTYVYLKDLPSSFINEKLKGTGKTKTKLNQEVVYDVEKQGFRIINWDQVVEGPELVAE